MRFMFLILAACASLTGVAHAQEKACTEMWCQEGLSVRLEGAGSWPAGRYDFYIKADDLVVTCRAELPLRGDCAPSSECSHPDWRVGESGCALTPDAHSLHEISAAMMPRHIRIDIMRPDGKAARLESAVQGHCGYPNGKECDKRQCCSGGLTMPLEWR